MSDRAWHFLTQKPWTPWNKETQRKIYVAEQLRKNEERILNERNELKRKEDALEETAKLIYSNTNTIDKYSIQDNKAHPLNFMYSAPPGLKNNSNNTGEGENKTTITSTNTNVINEPDDVQQFRQLYSQAINQQYHNTEDNHNNSNKDNIINSINNTTVPITSLSSTSVPVSNPPNPTIPPHSTSSTSTTLEKEAGKSRAPGLSVQELKHRFPFLKNAPMEVFASNVQVAFHPLGKEIKNIQCIKCKQWGHEVGNKECPLFNVLRPIDEQRLLREDPMTAMQAVLDPLQESTNSTTKPLNNLLSSNQRHNKSLPIYNNEQTLKLKSSVITSLDSILSTALNTKLHYSKDSSSFSSSKPYSLIPDLDNSNLLPSETYEQAQQRLTKLLEMKAEAAQAIIEDGWGGIGIPDEVHGSSITNNNNNPINKIKTKQIDKNYTNEEDDLYQTLTKEEKEQLLLKYMDKLPSNTNPSSRSTAIKRSLSKSKSSYNSESSSSSTDKKRRKKHHRNHHREEHNTREDKHHHHHHRHRKHHKHRH